MTSQRVKAYNSWFSGKKICCKTSDSNDKTDECQYVMNRFTGVGIFSFHLVVPLNYQCDILLKSTTGYLNRFKTGAYRNQFDFII